MQRLVIGDFVTPAATLGSSLRLGGISFSRRYSIDPYYLSAPGQVVSGTAALPSDIYLYNNGVLIGHQRVAPGSFQLQNLVSLNGLQVTEVVVRDVLGNEQTITNPFYFSQALLREGLDEYSADIGVQRERFGVASNDYGKPGAAGFYRRGVSDALTLGVRGEALDRRYNLGPTASWRMGTWGVASAEVSWGASPEGSGGAVALAHSFSSPGFASSLAWRAESRDYPRAGVDTQPEPPARLHGHAVHADPRQQLDRAHLPGCAALGRASAAARRASPTATASPTRSTPRVRCAAPTASSARTRRWSRFPTTRSAAASSPRTAPSFRAAAASTRRPCRCWAAIPIPRGSSTARPPSTPAAPGAAHETIDPYLQYNFKRGIARGEYFRDSAADSGSYQLGFAGAVARVGDTWGLSRPIYDSYGMVKVEGARDVRVYANNIEVGRTDAEGELFIPRLASYFDNPIAIEDKDLPVDVIVPQTRYIVSPPLRSGVLIDFKARRVRAVAGRLVTRRGGERVPFADAAGEIAVPGAKPAPVYAARDGGFYVEGLAARDLPRRGQRPARPLRVHPAGAPVRAAGHRPRHAGVRRCALGSPPPSFACSAR